MAKQKSLIYNSFFNVLYQLLNVIFPFVTAIYVSHILMAESVGKVAYAQNIASYFVCHTRYMGICTRDCLNLCFYAHK